MDDTLKKYNRITWIDILKGLGIFFIVIGHVTYNDYIVKWAFSFHLQLFFFISGYLYKKKDIKNSILNKARTILLPYYFFGLFDLIYWYIFERKFRYVSQTLKSAIYGLITGNYDHLIFNIHLWFLPCFFISVVFYNLLRNKLKITYVFFISLLLFLLEYLIKVPSMFYSIDKIGNYLIFMSLGEVFAIIEKNKLGKRKQTVKAVYMTAIICVITNMLIVNYNKGCLLNFMTAMLGILGWGLLSYAMNSCEIIEKAGRNSLVILCIHGPVYRAIIKIGSLVSKVNSDIVRNSVVLSIIITIITLIICCSAGYIFNKYFPVAIGKKISKKQETIKELTK